MADATTPANFRLAEASRDRVFLAAALTLGMAATVGTAVGFEQIGGFVPCKLCLAQRIPYYFAIPVAAVAAIAGWRNGPGVLIRVLFGIVALAMIYNLGLAIYHSGVEWAWWAGPTDCGVVADGVVSDAGALSEMLTQQTAPSCDQAAGRFLGLSFAGWNVLASAFMAAIAFRGATIRPSR